MKNIAIILLCFLLFIGCNKRNEKIFLRVEIYYAIEDSFWGEKHLTRVLIRIPKDKTVKWKIDEKISLCFKNINNNLSYTSVRDGEKYCNILKGRVLGFGDDGTVLIVPDFSPLPVYDDKLKLDGRTKIIAIQVKIKSDGEIEYIKEDPIIIKLLEKYPIFLK